MQIIIDIDKYLYKTIKTLGVVVEDGDAVAVSEAIMNGIPLDKIRAEIERMDYLSIEDGSDGYDEYVDRYDVLQIINKYKAESEEV